MRPLPDPPRGLVDQVARLTSEPTSPLLEVLVDVLRERFGNALEAVILYGSCLHDDDVTQGLVDLYAIVSDYGSAYPERRLRWFNRWMPPNVFYVETPAEGPVLRSKYAVLSLDDLDAGCSRWFHSYVWARFAQPTRLIYARDAAAAARVNGALASAVLRFLHESAAALNEGASSLSAAQLWAAGLRRSYLAELRPEGDERVDYLLERSGGAYVRLAEAAAPALPDVLARSETGFEARASAGLRSRARRAWLTRRWQGRLLSLLRLSKALFTFENGVDYLAWKIERHTGHEMRVTPRLRRYPLIFAWGEIWRLLRSGALR